MYKLNGFFEIFSERLTILLKKEFVSIVIISGLKIHLIRRFHIFGVTLLPERYGFMSIFVANIFI